jgi:nucleoside transporter
VNDGGQRAAGRSVAARLAVMMFLHYFVMGAWIVTLTTFLLEPAGVGLNFTPGQVGWIYSTLAIGGLIAPLFVGILADRLFAGERVLGVLSIVSAGLLAAAARWCEQRAGVVAAAAAGGPDAVRAAADASFPPLFLVMLAYAVCLLITSTLSNVIAMRNLTDPGRSYGGVRLWGTMGWIAAGWAVGPLMKPPSPLPLYLGAAGVFVLGVYSLVFLPHTPPKGRASPIAEVVGLPALTLFRNFSFAVYAGCLFVVTVMQQWYGVYAPPYLKDMDVRPAATWMTIAQVVEVCSLLLIPFIRDRIGLKGLMTLGLVAWVVRNAAFTWGGWWVVVVVGLPLHGASYTFFTIVGSLYIDKLAPAHLRAGAQGLITLVSLGPGMMIGNWLASRTVEHYTTADVVAWGDVWFVPLVGCVAAWAAFAALFREPNGYRKVTPADVETARDTAREPQNV